MSTIVFEFSRDDPSLADWIAAGASGLAALAAVVLSFLAYRQMKANRTQAEATRQQVALMRAEAQEARDRRAEEDAAVQEQIAAMSGIARETRSAARAQLQPVVFAHAVGTHVRGPDDNLDVAEGQVAFPYYLANEGTGIALNIRHGVIVSGVEYEFGQGMELRVLRAGEQAPPIEAATGRPVQLRTWAIVQDESALPATWSGGRRTYWARFENVFGERFETRNPIDPRASATLEGIGDEQDPAG